MSQNDRFKRLGTQLRDEVKAKAKQRSVQLFGEEPSGTQDLGPKAFIEYCRRNWHAGPDAGLGFREGLLARVGAENFRDTVIQLYGGNEAVWPLPGEGTVTT